MGTLRPFTGLVDGGAAESLDVIKMRDGSFQSDTPVHAMAAFFNARFSIVSQVNPHIIQFFFNPMGAIGRPIKWPWRQHRGGFIATLLITWCKEHMIVILKVMHTAGLLFTVLGVDWGYLFLQEDRGDITIVPHAGVRDYLGLLNNIGSRAELEEKVQ